jgi:hypothetical protein
MKHSLDLIHYRETNLITQEIFNGMQQQITGICRQLGGLKKQLT